MSMSSEDIYIVVRQLGDDLQYLTPKGIWSKLPAEARKITNQDTAMKLTCPVNPSEVWRMSPVEGQENSYRVVAQYSRTAVQQPKTKKGKKKK